MNKKKIIMILVLVFVLILGGAGILYKQLGQKLAPNLLATQTPQETESTEASTPTTQENESEKILAPDFTVYDLDGNEVHSNQFFHIRCRVPLLPTRNSLGIYTQTFRHILLSQPFSLSQLSEILCNCFIHSMLSFLSFANPTRHQIYFFQH